MKENLWEDNKKKRSDGPLFFGLYLNNSKYIQKISVEINNHDGLLHSWEIRLKFFSPSHSSTTMRQKESTERETVTKKSVIFVRKIALHESKLLGI